MVKIERFAEKSSPDDVKLPPPNRSRFNAFQAAEKNTPSGPYMSEDSASDTSDLPPPWEQPVEVDNMAEVKYQGPVTIHTMVDPVPGPSFEDQANAMPKRDKIIQICQSDEMFTWVHALATILVINEKAVLGGLKVSEQLKTIENTTWAEAMTARPVMGTDGLLTIAIGDGPSYKVLPKITSYFGVLAALFKKLWDQAEMHETLETDDNFEIVASTVKAIYDQTCRSCGVINRLIIYMQKDGKKVRKMRIDHEVGDTPAKLRLLRPKLVDKRQSEDTGPVSDKRQKEDRLLLLLLKAAAAWWLVAGGWWLVAGGWWLVAGGWWLVAVVGGGVLELGLGLALVLLCCAACGSVEIAMVLMLPSYPVTGLLLAEEFPKFEVLIVLDFHIDHGLRVAAPPSTARGQRTGGRQEPPLPRAPLTARPAVRTPRQLDSVAGKS
ncbi:hypothetical protein AK812_SmicGene1531 [Symbiodinium microadriaticum]|uniref:Uncharacterized protein n=1 Tax=Symbiodinium microadriaticum TaxID=2951 RepID=A0A1Q9F3T3_SYMMI|nr:hypothetical protein AK812_SmicGene1531 [Symbiodinium microadriaticum]